VWVTRPRRGGHPATLAVRLALWWVGARARILRPDDVVPDEACPLILSGGAHVGASWYGEQNTAAASKYDRERDVFEQQVWEKVRRAGERVLGICRGLQLAAVASGGTLYQDVWRAVGRRPPMRSPIALRRVSVVEGSGVAALVGAGSLQVNSIHEQAVRRLPEGWRTIARDRFGVVQGVEAPGFVGVQWHPEYLLHRRRQRRLFGWVAGLRDGLASRSRSDVLSASAVC